MDLETPSFRRARQCSNAGDETVQSFSCHFRKAANAKYQRRLKRGTVGEEGLGFLFLAIYEIALEFVDSFPIRSQRVKFCAPALQFL